MIEESTDEKCKPTINFISQYIENSSIIYMYHQEGDLVFRDALLIERDEKEKNKVDICIKRTLLYHIGNNDVRFIASEKRIKLSLKHLKLLVDRL